MNADVEILYKQLYLAFRDELLRLNIGYAFDKDALCYMNDIINAIDHLTYGNPNSRDAVTILKKYDKQYATKRG